MGKSVTSNSINPLLQEKRGLSSYRKRFLILTIVCIFGLLFNFHQHLGKLFRTTTTEKPKFQLSNSTILTFSQLLKDFGFILGGYAYNKKFDNKKTLLVKLSREGTLIWTVVVDFPDSPDNFITAVCETVEGDIIVLINKNDPKQTFDTTNTLYNHRYNTNTIAKFNGRTGEKIWEISYFLHTNQHLYNDLYSTKNGFLLTSPGQITYFDANGKVLSSSSIDFSIIPGSSFLGDSGLFLDSPSTLFDNSTRFDVAIYQSLKTQSSVNLKLPVSLELLKNPSLVVGFCWGAYVHDYEFQDIKPVKLDNGFLIVANFRFHESNHDYDTALLKVTRKGELQWSRPIGYFYGTSGVSQIIETKDSGYLLVGLTPGNREIFLMKYSFDGVLRWSVQYQGYENLLFNHCSVILRNDSNLVLLVGYTSLFSSCVGGCVRVVLLDEKGGLIIENSLLPVETRVLRRVSEVVELSSSWVFKGVHRNFRGVKVNNSGISFRDKVFRFTPTEFPKVIEL